MQILESSQRLENVKPNIGVMLYDIANRFESRTGFQEKHDGKYEGLTWGELYVKVEKIAYNLTRFGFTRGDKIVIYSKNRLEMLLLELAVMASGGIAIPIFFNYNSETAELLIKHSDASYLAVGDEVQLLRLSPGLNLKRIFVFDRISNSNYNNLVQFSELLSEKVTNGFTLDLDASTDDICLKMYTSGTMGNQKCVQLTHGNILSQQAALKKLWNIDENDRFLSYLRWHHSFGGIFELFTALSNGALLSLESSNGLDPDVIFENWKIVQPTLFFSVPLIYQQLIDITMENKEAEELFFHSDLKFVFTAAAPLPKHISDEFEKRKINVVEGWGLTETSPCCTLTDPDLKRAPGVIGKPIAGVTIALAEEDNEILVKGPNVMKGYYKDDESNKTAFNEDGWFCTGDIGEFTETGLKLITRKDRIFKLLNAEKVIPTELEGLITGKCHFVSYALVEGSGKNYPVALIFPNKRLMNEMTESNGIKIDNCVCPEGTDKLAKCLKGCLTNVNDGLKQKFARIKSAVLIDEELSVENKTLTPSMKLAPNSVKSIYKTYIEDLYDAAEPRFENAYVIVIEE
ncbi:MAG: AMP-binding protein [Ignavibacteriae bacterium]|nr:AMP-binding protein [Ignavibacteriota bacterium]